MHDQSLQGIEIRHTVTSSLRTYLGAVTSLTSVFVVIKYTPPCCRASYVWYLKQTRRFKYTNEQAS